MSLKTSRSPGRNNLGRSEICRSCNPPEAGIRSGGDWEQTLYQKLRQCQAVIALLTPSWLASKWCFVELAQARAGGKAIFPIKIQDCQAGGVFSDVPPAAVIAKVAAADSTPPKLAGDAAGLTLLAYPSLRFYDGRSAVSSWLQEAPDSMTQAVWDAWVEISTDTAKKLGVVQGDMLAVKSPQGTIELPAYVTANIAV